MKSWRFGLLNLSIIASLLLSLVPFQAEATAVPPRMRHEALTQPLDYQSEIMADGPLAYWRLGETSGSVANDASGNGLHGTITGGVTLGASGALYNDSDTAMQFNGTNGYIAAPSGFSDFTSGLTVEAWIYPTSTAYSARIIDFGTGIANNNIIFARDGSSADLAFQVYTGGTAGSKVIAPGVLQLNTWQHVAASMDASGYTTIYYNGLRVAAGPTSVPSNVLRTKNYIARNNWMSDPYYAGSIDEVAIYSTALSSTRIQAHYAAGTPPPPSPPPPTAYQAAVMDDSPTAYWRLGDTGVVAKDLTGNGNNGAIAGGVTRGVTGALYNDSDTAMQFNGTNGYIAVAPGFSDFTSGLTVEAWIYPTSTAYSARIIDFGTGIGSNNIIFARDGGSSDLAFKTWIGGSFGGSVIAPGVLQLNTWQHVAASMDATGYTTIYYNGLRVAAGPTSVPSNVLRTKNYIARNNWMSDPYYAGSIDEVAIYSTALSSTRIQAHYAAGSPPPPTPPPPSVYQSAVMADSPTAYWRLADIGVVAKDLTGNGNNGAIVGGVTRGVTGALLNDTDTAMQFNGTSGHIAVAPGFSDFTSGLTVEAWIHPTSTAYSARIIDFGTGIGSNNIIFARDGGSSGLALKIWIGGAFGGSVIAPGVLQLNTWQHVAATLDASGHAIVYYNGTPAASGQVTVPNNILRTKNYIARNNWMSDPYYAGSIDEVTIYTAPLSPERIRAHYSAGSYGLTAEGWNKSLEALALSYRAESNDPVDTGSGVFMYSHTDTAIPGRGPSPSLTRSYNSADTASGPLGPGWTHGYNSRIVRDINGRIAVVSPNGRRDVYTYAGGGTFTPPQGVTGGLSQEASTGNFLLVHKDQTTWTYDVDGRLINIKDRYGNQSTLTYNTNGQLTSIGDPAGRGSLSLAYDSCYTGRLCSITDWASPARVVQYGYDGNGRLTSVTDREGKVTTYGYDGTSSRLTTITDARGNVAVTNTYDAQGRVATQKDARGLLTGEQTTFDYTSVISTTVVTYPATSFDPGWHPTVSDTYDANGRVTKRVSKPTADAADDITEEYGYDANAFRTSVKDGRGNTTNLCYDVDYAGAAIAGSRGNLTRRIDPPPSPGANRPVTLYKYDAKNNPIQTIPPRGVNSGTSVDCGTNLSGSINLLYATDMTYDATTQTKLESTTSRYTDPDLGQQTAVTKLEYGDAANPGLVTKAIPPRGNTGPSPDYTYATSSTYFTTGTKAGLLQSVTDALGNQTTYDYDAVGRQTQMVDPNGNAAGGVPADHTWQFTYDKEDRLRFSMAPPPQPGGNALVTESRYDDVGNRTVVIDANGQVSTYAYDERDSLLRVLESPIAWTDPAIQPSTVITTAYQYDNAGNLSRVTRATDDTSYERAVDYAYDGLNRLRKETQYPSWPSTTPTLVTAYTYDRNGNRLTLQDPLGQTTTFAYDALNRLTSISYSDGQTPNVSYTYDADGNRLSMVDGTGTTSYTYDEQSRPLTVTTPGPKTVGYRYDLDGNRTKLIYPDSTAATYSFDKASRLQSLQDWASRGTSYQYFPDSSLKTITNFNGTTAEYSYDNAARLLDVWNKQGTNTVSRHSYTLDAVGNRTQANELLPQLGPPGSGSPSSTTYGYDRLYQLTTVTAPTGTTGYGYDPVGNRLSMSRAVTTTYSYDRADRLQSAGATSYTLNANGNLVARGTDSFAYDQANRLKSATIGGATSTYAYDGDGQRVSKTVGITTTNYVYDVNRSLPVLLDDGSRKYVWGMGLTYAVGITGTLEVYYSDGLGSVRAIADANGNVVQTYQTDEFGVPGQTQGASIQPFQYTGEQWDAESGLVYLRARMYDPVVGRFISRDPFGGYPSLPSSLNGFSYTYNGPINRTDPNGENPLVAACAGGALFDVAVTVGTHLVTKEKLTGSQVLRSAALGCGSGLTGFGVGKLIGRAVLARGAFASVEPVGRSLGAASRAEMVARELKLKTNDRILKHLDMPVTEYIGKFRKGSIRGRFPTNLLQEGVTVEQALREGGTTVRKLLTDGRFAK